MRALIVLMAWLAAAAPALAFGHFAGPRPGFGPHPGGPGHGHRGRGGLGFFGGGVWPSYSPPADQPAPVAVPVPYPVAAPYCPAPVVIRAPGPHIIYIGHQPKVSGPKVIYGTE